MLGDSKEKWDRLDDVVKKQVVWYQSPMELDHYQDVKKEIEAENSKMKKKGSQDAIQEA